MSDKIKTETIEVVVAYEIEYEPDIPLAREHAIQTMLRDMPNSLSGGSAKFGCYGVKRKAARLAE